MFFVKITFSVISGPIILAKVVKNTVDFSEKNLIIHTKLFWQIFTTRKLRSLETNHKFIFVVLPF